MRQYYSLTTTPFVFAALFVASHEGYFVQNSKLCKIRFYDLKFNPNSTFLFQDVSSFSSCHACAA